MHTVFLDAGSVRVDGSPEFPPSAEDYEYDGTALKVVIKPFFNWDSYGRPRKINHGGATIHPECFNLFRRNCPDAQAGPRLLLAGRWRSPWEGAPKFILSVKCDVTGLTRLAAIVCNMPQLELMPTELKRLVWEELATQPCALTRYYSVVSLATDACRQPLDGQTSMPIAKVAHWERGQGPASEEDVLPPVIRIIIDCQGISRIERLAKRPEAYSQPSDAELYIVESQETLKHVEVQFQSGLARLRHLGGGRAIHLLPWDTPSPPVVKHLLSPTSVAQFSTIEVSKITGITFFLTWENHQVSRRPDGPQYFMHAHTLEEPCARSTYDKILHPQGWAGIWHYVPFPDTDRLTCLGVEFESETTLKVLFRFEKAGDVMVGIHYNQYPGRMQMLWPASDRLRLICGLSRVGSVITLDAHGKGTHAPGRTFGLPFSQSVVPFAHGGCMSWAPLSNVARLRLFTDKASGICQGLLLEYEDGGQRSLGECRVGIDVEQAYVRPTCLCIGRQSGYSLWRMEVRVDGQGGHEHPDLSWKCYQMRGKLVSWQKRGFSTLKVLDEDDDVVDNGGGGGGGPPGIDDGFPF
ncbi:hypothetical protein THARTR1_00825 [Trichoderma harzianum]|uniref:Uncharacterized protein n=1 Tax=Trichoderma harzianum TaxID=5544 RepID=A0A2K0UNK5_TRIHA|nr:hypothetical protein THARTR1_00825 [Trichoderma harzianum]